MSFDFSDFLRVAEELANGQVDQAKLRSATSRLYYGVRGYADAVAKSEGGHYRGNESLVGHLEAKHAAIGADFRGLWTARIHADYHPSPAVSLGAFQVNLRTAKKLAEQLKALLPKR